MDNNKWKGKLSMSVEYLDMYEQINAVVNICGCEKNVKRLLCKTGEGYSPSPQKNVCMHLCTLFGQPFQGISRQAKEP